MFDRLALGQGEIGMGDKAVIALARGFIHLIQRGIDVVEVISQPAGQAVAGRDLLQGDGHRGHRSGRDKGRLAGDQVHQPRAARPLPVVQKARGVDRVGQVGPGVVPDLLCAAQVVEDADIADRDVIGKADLARGLQRPGAAGKLVRRGQRAIKIDMQPAFKIIVTQCQPMRVAVGQGGGQDVRHQRLFAGPGELQRGPAIGVADDVKVAKSGGGDLGAKGLLLPDQFQREGLAGEQRDAGGAKRGGQGGIGGDQLEILRLGDARNRVFAVKHVIAGPAKERIGAGPAIKRVIACAALQPVGAVLTIKPVARRIAEKTVIAATGAGVFDQRAKGDAEIAGKAADIGIAPGFKPYHLIGGVKRQVQHVAAAAVPDRQHRVKVLGEIINPGFRRAKAIGGIARPRGRVRAVNLMQRQHVMDAKAVGVQV